MSRIYLYLFASINFLALTCLFIVSFVNVIFIREEYLDIPEIKSSNLKNFIIPNEVKNDNYNFKILDNNYNNLIEKLNSKNIEFKNESNNSNKNLLNKNNFLEKEIKKFIVQLGVFKNKKNADNQLSIIKKQKKDLFKDVQINLFKTTTNNNLLYYIETNRITKINALNVCDFFKNKNINCIIKIRN